MIGTNVNFRGCSQWSDNPNFEWEVLNVTRTAISVDSTITITKLTPLWRRLSTNIILCGKRKTGYLSNLYDLCCHLGCQVFLWRDTKLVRFLAKNQHTYSKRDNCILWIDVDPSNQKLGIISKNKLFSKNIILVTFLLGYCCWNSFKYTKSDLQPNFEFKTFGSFVFTNELGCSLLFKVVLQKN